MRTIHKTRLDTGLNGIYTPPGSKFFMAREQDGQPTAWYTVPDDEAKATEYHNVYVIGTGGDTNGVPIALFIGSCFCGPFVWHVFAE